MSSPGFACFGFGPGYDPRAVRSTTPNRRSARVQGRADAAAHPRAGRVRPARGLCGHQVRLIASLPCYLAANVDGQRGRGVYAGSIEAIRRLNAIGYGTEPDLPLDLVYNPAGPSLPPPQHALEADYRRELLDRFG